MPTRTFATAGVNTLWSNAANWDTGVPGNTDTAVIPVGQTATFDVDQSGFAAGITLTLNGTLKFITDGTVTHLKLAAHITGTGSLYVGEDGDPIPAPGGATPEVATIQFAGAFNITGNLAACQLWGEERHPFYWIASKTDNTTIVLENGSEANWLRAGDVIVISDSTAKGQHAPASETFTVDSYAHDGTKGTITLNAGTPLARAVNQNSVVDAVAVVSRNIKVFNSVGESTSAYSFATGTIAGGVARGVRFYYLYGALYSNCTGWTLVSCVADDLRYGFGVSASTDTGGHSLTDCLAFNVSMLSYGSQNINCDTCITINTGRATNGAYGLFTDCVFLNTDYPING